MARLATIKCQVITEDGDRLPDVILPDYDGFEEWIEDALISGCYDLAQFISDEVC